MTMEVFHHDASVQKLRHLATSSALRERVTELFIAGIATGVHRAMTPLIAYYSARTLPDHTYEAFDYKANSCGYPNEESVSCSVCGLPHRVIGTSIYNDYHVTSREETLSDFSSGRCSMTCSTTHLVDLEDVENIRLEYKPEHTQVLRSLLQFIDSVSAQESKTQLEKQLTSARIIPKSNKVSRFWCLCILSELGVITNAMVPGYSGAFNFYSFLQRFDWEKMAFANLSEYAEPAWPLSAGRGQPAIDWALACQIFPQLNA